MMARDVSRFLPRARCVVPAGLSFVLLVTGCAVAPPSTSTSTPVANTVPPTEAGAKTTTAKERLAAQEAAAKQSGQAGTLGKKPLATFEGDLACTNLVAPFDLTDNAAILAGLGMDGMFNLLTESTTQWFKQWAQQPVQSSAVATAKHNISYEMRATAVRMNWLPMQAEVLYGRTVLEAKNKAGDIQPRDNARGQRLYPKAQALLDEALKAVDEPHDYKFEVHVTVSEEKNAQALPGGIILIDRGLLTDDPEAVKKAKFAIGHEIGHVLQRHETRAVQARIIDTVSLRGSVPELVKTIRRAQSEPAALISLVVAGKLQFERHFANQELAADGCGVRIANNMLKNDTQLIAVLNAFIASLPKPTEDDKPDPFAKAVPQVPSKAPTAVAGAEKALATANDLMTLVTRPIDQHPATAARVKNLNLTLAEIRKRRDEATADALKKKALIKAKDKAPVKLPLPAAGGK